ncbi:MAG TPA: acyl-CoA dehydrogenase [Planctomycetes bacterium]|nr:acyl-CoA dehydrogenase [Planctomycetaceae bacterium]HIM29858.1 acyl-CoA dehydrogenase [Planctomycetota bacterium]
MDLNLTPDEQKFRDELRSWLAANVPEPWPGHRRGEADAGYWDHLRDWQQKLFGGGWAGVSWPVEYGGRGASPIQQSIFLAEVARARAPEHFGVIGEGLVGPTIMAVGSEQQKQKFLPRILSGKDIWCQGYSEPNSGSDLASLSTRAIRDGEHFVVNGQKIWTSFAQIADWCLLLVRTDTSVAKHKGITCLLVDMKSPGVSTKPLRQMSGDSGFNEVFFTDVRVPIENQLGELNNGWRVGLVVLMNERANLGASVYVSFEETMRQLIEHCRTRKRNGRLLAEDPLVRQNIAQAHVELELFRLNTDRALSRSNAGETPGPEGSILKLYWSEMNQRLSQTAMEILGDTAQLSTFDNGNWAYRYLRSRGNTIEGGTSEIQRNILAERVLGMPKSY